MKRRVLTLLSTVAVTGLMAGVAFADDQATPATQAAPAAPTSWASGIKVSGHVEVGGTVNPADPGDGINFGHLFTDKSNQIVLNQAALTIERDPDPKSSTIDIGFKVQGMYGSDSRYTHFLGELDHETSGRNSFDVVEANITAHLPFLTAGGTDVKLGQFSTPIGYEVIDPTGNFFYSKSYIFNFGIPLKHTGIFFTTHVNPILDVYYGYTTGVNTSVGSAGGYNDGQFHFLGGFGLNLKNLTILALTHIGPENPLPVPGVNIHKELRYLNDVIVTWKITDKLTSVTELNYIRDDNGGVAGGAAQTGGGVAEYLTYPLSSTMTAGIRAEVWRDAQGFWVGSYANNEDFLNVEEGKPYTAYFPGPTTYGAITVGVNIKPTHLPKIIDGMTIRPELRYDRALAGATPFSGDLTGQNKDQFTFGLDVVVPLTF